MTDTLRTFWVAGVDGRKGGWIAVFLATDDPDRFAIRSVGTLAEVVDAPERPVVVAVDTPVGLPKRITGGGRAPEVAVRPLLGARQSSVFSMPGRAAVYAEPDHGPSMAERLAAHRRASALARTLSDPPRGISFQGFNIFDKVRDANGLLRARPALIDRLVECHPEVSFRMMAGQPLAHPKKIKGRVSPDGMIERRALLIAAGLSTASVDAPSPRGVGRDDLIDAMAAAWTAKRVMAGTATRFPAAPERDPDGIPVVIMA
jgi:predicted RNase H-like nuclease